MAQTRGGQYAVFGNLAYDFRNTETYPCEEYGLLPEDAKKPKKSKKTRGAARSRQGISLLALIGTPLAAAMLVFSIMAQIHLVTLSDQTVELSQRIIQLRDENTRLGIEYAMSFELAELDSYARTELGMRRPSADQINYIDTSSPSAEETKAAENGFFGAAAEVFDRIGEYFS